MDRVILRSYAKVNLTLDVFHKRPDGYHDISSVMQTVSLHDVVTVEKAPIGVLEVDTDNPLVPRGQRNLAYQAAVLIDRLGHRPEGARIYIRKAIPTEAGLGGGSSNAAAALVGLNRLYGLGLEPARLAGLAASLGSDVPFFISGGTALAEGRGEKLSELPDAPPMIFVLVKPDVGVPTKWAYAALDEAAGRAPGGATEPMVESIRSGGLPAVHTLMSNDFEEVVLPAFPRIREAGERLSESGASATLLAGSGAAVFGVFESESKAVEVSRQLSSLGKTFTARSVRRAEARNPWL